MTKYIIEDEKDAKIETVAKIEMSMLMAVLDDCDIEYSVSFGKDTVRLIWDSTDAF